MAPVDADYKFSNATVGSQGRLGDGAVFKESEFYQKMSSNTLNLPDDRVLPALCDASENSTQKHVYLTL